MVYSTSKHRICTSICTVYATKVTTTITTVIYCKYLVTAHNTLPLAIFNSPPFLKGGLQCVVRTVPTLRR